MKLEEIEKMWQDIHMSAHKRLYIAEVYMPTLLYMAKDARHVIDHIAKSHKEMTIESLYEYLTKLAKSLEELEKV